MTRRIDPKAAAAACLLMLAACGKAPTGQANAARLPEDATLSQIPLGAPPGQPVSIAADIKNPFEGDARAIQDGKTLFTRMNCVYCHGSQGSGLMGPALNDPNWRFGGTPAEIYNSIHDGRPKGMPAWGQALPPDQIWRLVAYIESLGGAEAPATPQMVALGGPQQSTTGPEPADQVQADTAHTTLLGAEHGQRR